MSKRDNLSRFFKLSPEEQAIEIEKQTKKLINRLPDLKKKLKMYGDTSDEMYNLTGEEIGLMGSTYASAVRGGEITTPTSKQAYRSFIKNLRKYARTDLGQLARQTAEQRLDSWINHIKEGSNNSDSAYAQQMLEGMSEEEKLGFTRSKYFMDSSYMYFITELDGVQYSIQTLKLELYLEEIRGKTTKHIYRSAVKGNEDTLRKYQKKRGK